MGSDRWPTYRDAWKSDRTVGATDTGGAHVMLVNDGIGHAEPVTDGVRTIHTTNASGPMGDTWVGTTLVVARRHAYRHNVQQCETKCEQLGSGAATPTDVVTGGGA